MREALLSKTETTPELLEKIEMVLHRNFDAEAAEWVERVRLRWSKLKEEKRYWHCRCTRFEKRLEKLHDQKDAPSEEGAGDSVDLG